MNQDIQTNDGDTGLADIFRMIDKLLFDKKDVEVALVPGRTLLMIKDYDRSLKAFEHVLEIVPTGHHDYYIILGNIGYALIGQAKYDEAIKTLLKVNMYNNSHTFFVWHMMALAYAYFKKNDMDEFQKWLNSSKNQLDYNAKWYETLYPEIKQYL